MKPVANDAVVAALARKNAELELHNEYLRRLADAEMRNAMRFGQDNVRLHAEVSSLRSRVSP